MFVSLVSSGSLHEENSEHDDASIGELSHNISAQNNDFNAVLEEFSPVATPPPSSQVSSLKFQPGTPSARSTDDKGHAENPESHGEIRISKFEELEFPPEQIRDVQKSWDNFCDAWDSREAAGEAIYNALFEVSPTLQPLFTTPKAVQATKFMSAMHTFVQALGDPPQLKTLAETHSFRHLNIDVTVQRVALFRNAIVDMFCAELGQERAAAESRAGWNSLLNYIGGAFIFVKKHYADTLQILSDSWKLARGNGNGSSINHTKSSLVDTDDRENELEDDEGLEHSTNGVITNDGRLATPKVKTLRKMFTWMSKTTGTSGSGSIEDKSSTSPRENDHHKQLAVNATYQTLFDLNMEVMGLGKSRNWLLEVRNSFDAIVTNVSNPIRFQQECEVLAIKLSKVTKGADKSINLAQYKSLMLASMRGVLAKRWDNNYELAWNWLWNNVDRLLVKLLGNPPKWEASLTKLLFAISEEQMFDIRKSIYECFFASAPSGQDYFKQSNTRLHYIADRVLMMTTELFANPWKMVDDVSALGLRHVGYAVPTDLFGPFVSACIKVVGRQTDDEEALEAFRWSLSLISKMLVGTITEGSTIVMQAINENSVKQLQKAICCAPRNVRAQWLLRVQVGTQSISPLNWALGAGLYAAAQAILEDLLTIRADRERYYYGMEELFERHPDIVSRLSAETTDLLFKLFNGLVWRSRVTNMGMRRANYFVKYLIVDGKQDFADALEVFTKSQNPQVFSHHVVRLLSETMWDRIVRWTFISSRLAFVVSLVVFMLGQAILPKLGWNDEKLVRIAIFCCRMVGYVLTMCRLMYNCIALVIRNTLHGDVTYFCGVPIPNCLLDTMQLGTVMLAIFVSLMCATEPMLYCINSSDFPIEECPESANVIDSYSLFAMWAMMLHWMLLVDLAVFSTGLSAFVLVCVHVSSEIRRFLVALVFCLFTFGSAISVLDHTYADMIHFGDCVVSLFAVTLRVFEDDYRDFQNDVVLLIMVFIFITVSAILLLNLLIAQLNCSYVYVYENMCGFARMRRAEVIVEMLGRIKRTKWLRFVDSLGMDEPLEFNAGDVGIPGGLTVEEPACSNSVSVDTIVRYGGSCDPELEWPESKTVTVFEEENDAKYKRIEKLIARALKKLANSQHNPQGRPSRSDKLTSSSMTQNLSSGKEEDINFVTSSSASETVDGSID